MSQQEKPTTAFVLSLLAGIFILLNGLAIAFVSSFLFFLPVDTGIPSGALPFLSGIFIGLMAVGIVFGLIVLIGSIMLYRNPSQKTAWGVIIIIFSIISIVIGGGFIIGLILGIVGGALALAWKPKTPVT